MKLPANAALSLTQRRRMVSRILEQGWSSRAAAAAAETSPRTLWDVGVSLPGRRRVRFADRSSAPVHVANRTDEQTVQVIAALRRLRSTGAALRALAAGRAHPRRRQEARPDRRRRGQTRRGSHHRQRRPYLSAVHAIARRLLGVRHLRTRPRRPQTNGKVERFIRTMRNGWAYGAIHRSSQERTAALDGWLWRYDHHRPHSAIGRQPRITRLNNLLGSYIQVAATSRRTFPSLELVKVRVDGAGATSCMLPRLGMANVRLDRRQSRPA